MLVNGQLNGPPFSITRQGQRLLGLQHATTPSYCTDLLSFILSASNVFGCTWEECTSFPTFYAVLVVSPLLPFISAAQQKIMSFSRAPARRPIYCTAVEGARALSRLAKCGGWRGWGERTKQNDSAFQSNLIALLFSYLQNRTKDSVGTRRFKTVPFAGRQFSSFGWIRWIWNKKNFRHVVMRKKTLLFS